MRWQDERYVRVYTRETPGWLLLSWQARAIFHELLRKVDRAGILSLGTYGTKGLAATVRIPLDVVDQYLPELVSNGCVEIHDTDLVIPNFIEAQESTSSPAQRKRRQRELDRAAAQKQPLSQQDGNRHTESHAVTVGHSESHAVTERDEQSQPVTNRDQVSQNVTDSHKESHAVTSGHSVLYRAVPNSAVPDPPYPQRGNPAQVSDQPTLPDLDPPAKPRPAHGLLGTLAKAYGDGIREASGAPFVDPTASYDLRELKSACEAHCGAANTMEAQVWLRRSAAEYRRATAHEAKYQSGFSPKAWAKWLQAGKPEGEPPPPKEIKPPYHRPFPGLEPLPRRGIQ